MNNLESLIVYICLNYPYGNELSKARLTKLVYLMDWESCLLYGRQMTDIHWFFHNFGPYVDDVIYQASVSSYLTVQSEMNFYGDMKERICLRNGVGLPHYNLSHEQMNIANNVLLTTQPMYWNEFISYVYSTPPVANANRYEYLDLVAEARRVRGGNTFQRI